MLRLRRIRPEKAAELLAARKASKKRKEDRQKMKAAIAADLRAEKLTYHQIAAKHKTHYTTVMRVATEQGLMRRGSRKFDWDTFTIGDHRDVPAEQATRVLAQLATHPDFIAKANGDDGGIRIVRVK